MITETHKTCNACKKDKKHSYFYIVGKRNGDRFGLQSICKTCSHGKSMDWAKRNPIAFKISDKKYRDKHKERRKKQQYQWVANNKEYSKDYHREYLLRKKYGIGLIEYDELIKIQKGQCAICGTIARLVVDHDHKTGKVRELLCDYCNLALGLSKESIETLQKLIVYLQKHG